MSGQKTAPRFRQAADGLFLIALWIYLFYAFAAHTTMDLPFPADFGRVYLPVLGAAALLRSVGTGSRRYWILALGMGLIYFLVWWQDRYLFLLYLAVITIGTVGLDHRRLLVCFLTAVSASLALAVAASLCGGITDLIYMDDGFLRSSLGVHYPTDYASIVFFLVIFLWVAWPELPEGVMLLPAGLSLWNAAVVARSQTSAYASLLLIVCILYRMLEQHLLEKKRFLRWIPKGVGGLLRIAFPAACVGILAMVWLYGQGNTFALRLNDQLSARLYYAWRAYQVHGLHPFGTPFKQIGNGSSTAVRPDYNFVDISYALILLRYGWVTLLAITGLWVHMTHRALRSGNRRLAFCLALLAFHALSEHHFTEPEYNLLLALPFASLEPSLTLQDRASRQRASLRFLAAGLGIGVAILLAPPLLSWLRTIAQQRGWQGSGTAVLPMLALLVAGGLVYTGLWLLGLRLAEKALAHTPLPRRLLAGAGALLLLLGGGLWKLNRMALQPSEAEAQAIASSADAVALIAQSAEHPLYADETPEWFADRYPDIQRSLLSGDELARLSPASIITAVDRDSPILLRSGFLYTPLSPTHALYTSDQAVVAALQEAGYHLTGYYPGVYTVNAKKEARRNGLTRKGKTLLLDGPTQSIAKGPYVALYAERCVVTYSLHAEPAAWEEGEEICELVVTGAKGLWTFARQILTRESFDEKGNCQIALTFTPWEEIPNFEFLALAREGKQLEVRSITYQHQPVYDTHAILGEDHRSVQEEYFDLEGNPYWINDSYTTVTLERDERGNVLVYHYYGPGDVKVLANSGYWVRRCRYDDKNRVIRESLYGLDDEPILVEWGYASWERSYDDAGNVTQTIYYDVDGNQVEAPE